MTSASPDPSSTPAADATSAAARSPIAGRSRAAVSLFFVLAALVLAGDLWLKAWAFEHVAGRPIGLNRENATLPGIIPPHDGIGLVPKVLRLKLTTNEGAVFGLGQGGRWFFIIVTVVAVTAIVTLFWRSPRDRRWLHVALALVLAGALGNLYDRIVYGVVRDMLYLFPDVNLPFGWTWPNGSSELYPWIFNVADVALVCGVAMILLSMLKSPKAAAA